mmetsp:Transcript_1383/g.3913  ORF Transcript_1383/g.3913 Transcript_1383/m.3913 type:complete len:228 (+) Transcript_1383:47-730(+)
MTCSSSPSGSKVCACVFITYPSSPPLHRECAHDTVSLRLLMGAVLDCSATSRLRRAPEAGVAAASAGPPHQTTTAAVGPHPKMSAWARATRAGDQCRRRPWVGSCLSCWWGYAPWWGCRPGWSRYGCAQVRLLGCAGPPPARPSEASAGYPASPYAQMMSIDCQRGATSQAGRQNRRRDCRRNRGSGTRRRSGCPRRRVMRAMRTTKRASYLSPRSPPIGAASSTCA